MEHKSSTKPNSVLAIVGKCWRVEFPLFLPSITKIEDNTLNHVSDLVLILGQIVHVFLFCTIAIFGWR